MIPRKTPSALFVTLAAFVVLAATSFAPSASAFPAVHNCANPNKLYPWVVRTKGISNNTACAKIVALGKSVSKGKFPSLEDLITCVGTVITADNTVTNPGTPQLTRTSWHSWTLSLTPHDYVLKLTRGSQSFEAGQQDFGCF
jgi:hypothetical protein